MQVLIISREAQKPKAVKINGQRWIQSTPLEEENSCCSYLHE